VAKVTLYIDVNKTLQIVHELKQMGWVAGIDFDFAYNKAVWDGFSSGLIQEQHCVFIFYNDSNASYFMLRWG
jgi:hypothetical protein